MSAPASSPAEPAPARRGRPGYDRERVREIAVSLFNEQGYDATSVADVASRLGLSKSALYHHFSSKEELLEVALEEALGGLEAAIDAAERLDGPAAARLEHVVRGATDVLLSHLPAVTLLLRVRGNSAVELAALERRRRFDQRVTAMVSQAQADGALRADVDAPVVARLLFGMINSVVEWYRPDGPIDGARLGHDVVAVALSGLRLPSADDSATRGGSA